MAALDRQHPRDFFDVRQLLANEGITDEIRTAFIVYLLCHHRPMAEVLTAPPKDLFQRFDAEFRGMTDQEVTLNDLAATRTSLVRAIVGEMPAPVARRQAPSSPMAPT